MDYNTIFFFYFAAFFVYKRTNISNRGLCYENLFNDVTKKKPKTYMAMSGCGHYCSLCDRIFVSFLSSILKSNILFRNSRHIISEVYNQYKKIHSSNGLHFYSIITHGCLRHCPVKSCKVT